MTVDNAQFMRNLREKYPHPIKSDPTQALPVGTYCVGGALALELGYEAEGMTPMGKWVTIGFFPAVLFMAEVLREANPALLKNVSLDYAKLITQKNDTGNFETAWMHLADALGYGEGEWTPADDAAVARFLTGATS